MHAAEKDRLARELLTGTMWLLGASLSLRVGEAGDLLLLPVLALPAARPAPLGADLGVSEAGLPSLEPIPPAPPPGSVTAPPLALGDGSVEASRRALLEDSELYADDFYDQVDDDYLLA